MTISKKVQQAGSVSLPRGFQQPGRDVEIEVKDDNTLLLKFSPVVGHDGVVGSTRSSVDVYLLPVSEGDVHVFPRIRAQLRAIDETGRIIAAWSSSLLVYAMANFYDRSKDHDIIEKAKSAFPGKKVNFIDSISDKNIPLPSIVASSLLRVKARVESGEERAGE